MNDILTANRPLSWRLARLGQVFDERKQKASDKDYDALSVTMRGIVPQLDTAAKSDDGDNRKLVRVGDYVINSRSDRKGSGGISQYEGTVSLISIVLQPRAELIYPRFAHHLLRSYAFQEEFYRWGHGIVADLWTTRYFDMKNIQLYLPDFSTQKNIAAFLDRETARIDALIEKNERLIVLAGEKLRAEIDSVTQKAPGKVRVRMSKVCDYIPGKHLGVESTTTEPGDVRYLRTADLYEDMSFEKSPLWVSEPDDTELATENDVIVCFDGFVANGKTGTLGMAVTGVNGYVGPHLAKVRVRQSQHCSDLLCLAHLGSRFAREVVRNAEGVTARSGRRGVRYFDVYLDSDLKVQEDQAASLRDKIHKTQMLKANLKRLNVLLQEKRSALITAAVTGQIDIPE